MGRSECRDLDSTNPDNILMANLSTVGKWAMTMEDGPRFIWRPTSEAKMKTRFGGCFPRRICFPIPRYSMIVLLSADSKPWTFIIKEDDNEIYHSPMLSGPLEKVLDGAENIFCTVYKRHIGADRPSELPEPPSI